MAKKKTKTKDKDVKKDVEKGEGEDVGVGVGRDIGISAAPPKRACDDPSCPWHGTLPVRGQVLEGIVVSVKAQKTAIIEREHFQLLPKFERYERRHSRTVAYRPDCIDVKEGDRVRIAECRPLSKTKSFVVVEVLKK